MTKLEEISPVHIINSGTNWSGQFCPIKTTEKEVPNISVNTDMKWLKYAWCFKKVFWVSRKIALLLIRNSLTSYSDNHTQLKDDTPAKNQGSN